MAQQECAGRVGAVEFEPLVGTAVLLGQAEIVAHRADVKQFVVGNHAEPPPLQRTPQEDALAVVEQHFRRQSRRGVAHQLLDFTREWGVRNGYGPATILLMVCFPSRRVSS